MTTNQKLWNKENMLNLTTMEGSITFVVVALGWLLAFGAFPWQTVCFVVGCIYGGRRQKAHHAAAEEKAK